MRSIRKLMDQVSSLDKQSIAELYVALKFAYSHSNDKRFLGFFHNWFHVFENLLDMNELNRICNTNNKDTNQ